MIIKFIYGWFFYSAYYMLASAFMTVALNRVTKRLWLTPLIINAVSIVILLAAASSGWIPEKDATYAMYFNYMPIVFASVAVNLCIGIYRKLKFILNEKVRAIQPAQRRGSK
ncbi:hypothetical protein ACHAL6_10230 [Proteiniclasticum sp. C24MP]|uniref:hypothetical protein n=1 Tax=Proteiniclasticum sp. C24MP TaxID=3374101 RepID=UPI00375414C7